MLQEKIATLEAQESGAGGGAPILKDFTWLQQVCHQICIRRTVFACPLLIDTEHTPGIAVRPLELVLRGPTDRTWFEPFLQALDQLFVARRILGYSYVACFYLFDGVTYADDFGSEQNSLLRNLFEDAQGMLEMEVWLLPVLQ
jgi:hypothetical protein